MPRRAHLYLGTNFGVLVSDDDGARWSLSCEAAIGTAGTLSQMGWGAWSALRRDGARSQLCSGRSGTRPSASAAIASRGMWIPDGCRPVGLSTRVRVACDSSRATSTAGMNNSFPPSE